MEFERWQKLMSDLGCSENASKFENVVARYSESHRAYHNKDHINDCLSKLDALELNNDQRLLLEVSIWFHDLIYDSYGKENELKSADDMRAFLSEQNVNTEFINKVYAIIMATLHQEPGANREEQLMMDIDISILGQSKEIYEQYSKNVRKEYRWVPSFLYNRNRKKVLSSFLERAKLYQTEEFQHLEERARRNIKDELNS